MNVGTLRQQSALSDADNPIVIKPYGTDLNQLLDKAGKRLKCIQVFPEIGGEFVVQVTLEDK